MKAKVLSESQMAEMNAKIAEVEERRRRKLEYLTNLEKNGFDFSKPSVIQDLKLWIQSGKKLSSFDKTAVLDAVLDRGSVSTDVLLLLKDDLSSEELTRIVKAVADSKIDSRVLHELGNSVTSLLKNLLFDGCFDEYRERALLMLKLVKQGIADKVLFIDVEFAPCWMYVGKEIVDAIIEGWIPKNTLQMVYKDREFEFPPEVLVIMMKAVLEDKFQFNIVYDILTSKPCYKEARYHELVMPLLVEGFCSDKLSEEEFNYVGLFYNFFADDDWKKMYDSRIDFLVRGYMAKFYPEITVEF